MRRTIRKQLPAVVAEPVALLSVVRSRSLDERPEAPRVVEVDEVAQLVDDDVVEDPARRERQAPRERERALRRARAEARARVADREPPVPDADAWSLDGDRLVDELAREVTTASLGELRRGGDAAPAPRPVARGPRRGG